VPEKESTSQAEGTEVRNEEVAPDEGQQKLGNGEEGKEGPEATKEPKTLRTYGEDEWKTRESEFQSKFDSKVAELNKASKEAAAKLEEDIRKAQEAAEVKRDTEWLKSVETEGGDVDAAKQVVAERQAVRDRLQKVEEREQKATETEASQQSALKYLDAQKLAKEHDIPVEPLMEARSPEEMKVIALTEKIKKLETSEEKGKKRPVTSTDKGIGTGGGAGWRDLSADDKIRQGTK